LLESRDLVMISQLRNRNHRKVVDPQFNVKDIC